MQKLLTAIFVLLLFMAAVYVKSHDYFVFHSIVNDPYDVTFVAAEYIGITLLWLALISLVGGLLIAFFWQLLRKSQNKNMSEFYKNPESYLIAYTIGALVLFVNAYVSRKIDIPTPTPVVARNGVAIYDGILEEVFNGFANELSAKRPKLEEKIDQLNIDVGQLIDGYILEKKDIENFVSYLKNQDAEIKKSLEELQGFHKSMCDWKVLTQSFSKFAANNPKVDIIPPAVITRRLNDEWAKINKIVGAYRYPDRLKLVNLLVELGIEMGNLLISLDGKYEYIVEETLWVFDTDDIVQQHQKIMEKLTPIQDLWDKRMEEKLAFAQ